MKRTVLGSLALAAAVAALPATARAQNSFQQVVASQLSAAADTMRGRGFRALGQPVTGSLADDAQQTITLTLTAGAEVVVYGACDQDCRDFDLRIFAPGGTMVAEDIELDDQPLLTFRAPAAGAYRLVAIMANCTANPCFFGVQAFAR